MIYTDKQKKLTRMVSLALLSAIVVLLQIMATPSAGFLPTPFNFALIPIALGASLFGPWAGVCLGCVCGLAIVILGATGVDGFTAILFQNHPLLTTLLCLVKTGLGGFVAGVVYKVIAKKNSLLASFVCAALIPVINTGLFVLGSFTMMDTYQAHILEGQNMWYFLIITCSAVSFPAEFVSTLIFSPALHRVGAVVRKKLGQ